MIELLGQLGGRSDTRFAIGVPRARAPARRSSSPRWPRSGDFKTLRSRRRCSPASGSLRPVVRDRILGLLASRPSGPVPCSTRSDAARSPPSDLTPANVQLDRPSGRAGLWSSAWNRSGARCRERARPRRSGGSPRSAACCPRATRATPSRGKPIFKENCAVCHKLFDEGESIGPDLTGADRGNLDFLMTSLVDPSALIRKEYQSQTIALRDGRVLTGLVVDENDRVLTLVDSNRQKTPIARDLIEESKPADVSLMPEGLLEKLTEPQIRDLFRYLQSGGVR